jgi:tetratricopeptide (TPR) repeat protein
MSGHRRCPEPTRRARRSVMLASLVALLVAAPAAADDTIWSRATSSAGDRAAFDAAMATADDYTHRAIDMAHDDRGRALALALRAASAYEDALAIRPDAAEAHYRAAEVLYAHFVSSVDHPSPEPTRRAIDHWLEFERLAPRDPRLGELYFRRSLAYTKLGGDDAFQRGVTDYERELALLDPTSASASQMSLIYSNAAELYMGTGDLDRAIAYYRNALTYQTRPLYGYGLAVALDRDGQGVKAREVMRAYATTDHLNELFDDSVFFVPDGDIHYYQALGHEAMGQLQSAANHYRQYLRMQGSSRYAARARQNLHALESRLARPQKGRRPQPGERDI